MKPHVLRGSKQEIVERLARMTGEVRQAFVFEEEPVAVGPGPGPADAEDIFAEMRPFMVNDRDVDDSRASIYTRRDGE
jgi:hypothetical protein